MKNKITIILFLVSINLLAQKQRPTLFNQQKQSDSNTNILGVDLKNKTKDYLSAAGGCILVGSAIQIATSFYEQPTNIAELKEWTHNQKILRIASASFYAIGGTFIILASKNIIDNKTASLKLKVYPTSLGLCLNFK